MATTGNPWIPCNCRGKETGVPGGGCCFFETQEEPETTMIPSQSGFIVPEPNVEMLAAMFNPEQKLAIGQLKTLIKEFKAIHSEKVLAIAQLMEKTFIEDLKGVDGELGAADNAEKELALPQLMKTNIESFKGFNAKFGAEDNVGKARKTDSLARWGKAIVKGFNKCFM